MSDAARERARASARLGSTLRSVLVAPTTGFASAQQAADRRERTKTRSAEGIAPFVLAALGGAAAALLWLKLAGMVGWRDVAARDYEWTLLAAVLTAGALISLLGQGLWGSLAPRASERIGAELSGRDARLVWGLAGFPQVLVLSFLLPLDLLIVGPSAFATEPLGDSLSTAWAALSVALHLALAVWSLWLFARGTSVVSGLRPLPAAIATLAAALVVVGLVVGLALGAASISVGSA